MRGFDHAAIRSPSFHGLRKERLAQWPLFCVLNTTKNSGRGLPEKLGGGVRHAFLNPYPISDHFCDFSLPYFRPEPGAWLARVTSGYSTYTVAGVNIKGEMALSPNDEEVTNSSKKNNPIQD